MQELFSSRQTTQAMWLSRRILCALHFLTGSTRPPRAMRFKIQMMVTDLQGWKNSGNLKTTATKKEHKAIEKTNPVWTLTDPCLHCSRPGLIDYHGKDRGLVGMLEFFQSHGTDLLASKYQVKCTSSAVKEHGFQTPSTCIICLKLY